MTTSTITAMQLTSRPSARRRRTNSVATIVGNNFISMVALFLITVLCITEAIRPSAPVGNKVRIRRPLRRLWYRRLDEGTEEVTRSIKIPVLDRLRPADIRRKKKELLHDDQPTDSAALAESISREALASELSKLLDSIDTFAEELDKSGSMPPILQGTVQDKSNEKEDIKTVQQLRKAVLDEGKALKDVQLDSEAQLLVNATTRELLNHDVVELMVKRFKTGSTPGNRAEDDKARLALSIEGGGMRGAVSAGMASAIACLGLTDSFDVIYGSSAGSVIGGYMISRQMCMDIYVDILPAAKRAFVCTKRILSAVAISALDVFLSGVRRRTGRSRRWGSGSETTAPESLRSRFISRAPTGLNVSFVLDSVMDPEHGIRPMDMDTFQRNNKKQPLRVASSYVKDGKLHYKCFGTEDFFGEGAAMKADGKRKGLFACLEPSMNVPGATGPPVRLKTRDSDDYLPYFDAFCFEPLPYRSAVEEGATHVLVLCSRPEGFQPKTKPGIYEQFVTPLYFKSHGEPEVADFFSRGGQQYIYLEDMLTLEEGKVAGIKKEGPISVPPAKLLYGVEKDHYNHQLSAQRDEKWNKAHLLPLKVPFGTPELKTLEQDKDTVREAVKGGFAAAFDLLAPAIGLNTHGQLTGAEVAALIFPDKPGRLDEIILQEKLRIDGEHIQHPPAHHTPSQAEEIQTDQSPSGQRRRDRIQRDKFLRSARHALRIVARNKQRKTFEEELSAAEDMFLNLNGGDALSPPVLDTDQKKAAHLLNSLPGFQSGRMGLLAANLHYVASSPTSDYTSLRP